MMHGLEAGIPGSPGVANLHKTRLVSPPPPEPEPHSVVSPFGGVKSSVSVTPQFGGGFFRRWWLWTILGVLLAAGAVLLIKHLHDPFRTLEKLPVSKYLEDYRPLSGSRFKADLRVEADLGWKEGVGRLMVFTTPQDTRPIAVMIPAELAGLYFSKGQTYQAELEVKEGGLIYVNSCRKQ